MIVEILACNFDLKMEHMLSCIIPTIINETKIKIIDEKNRFKSQNTLDGLFLFLGTGSCRPHTLSGKLVWVTFTTLLGR